MQRMSGNEQTSLLLHLDDLRMGLGLGGLQREGPKAQVVVVHLQVVYLGHEILTQGISTDPTKG